MGTESRLLDCDTLPLGFPSDLCSSHDTDAGVICGKYSSHCYQCSVSVTAEFGFIQVLMNVLKEYILVAITQSVWINPEVLLVYARLGMLGTHLKDALVSITLLLLLLLW